MRFAFDATGIGSVPFTDPKKAFRVISENFKTIPFWPQLPKMSYPENMYVQYSERIPGLVVDTAGKNIHIESSRVASDIEEVYQKYLDGDIDFFKISENYAAGLFEFLKSAKLNDVKFIKGHITGPVSFGMFLTDEQKRAVIYDKDLFEVLTKVLVMKARWQIKKLKSIFPSVIIFIDEPYLVSIGSSYVNMDMALIGEKLDELIGAIKTEGCLAGIHCCGNTDWQFLLKRGIDILNFDAYNFMKEFLLYGEDIKGFLNRGGTIAWGVIPSSEEVLSVTKKDIVNRMKDALNKLKDKGIPGPVSSIITPSCGVGTLKEETAEKVFSLTREVSAELKK